MQSHAIDLDQASDHSGHVDEHGDRSRPGEHGCERWTDELTESDPSSKKVQISLHEEAHDIGKQHTCSGEDEDAHTNNQAANAFRREPREKSGRQQ